MTDHLSGKWEVFNLCVFDYRGDLLGSCAAEQHIDFQGDCSACRSHLVGFIKAYDLHRNCSAACANGINYAFELFEWQTDVFEPDDRNTVQLAGFGHM